MLRACAMALALLLPGITPAAPAGDPDWHIPLAATPASAPRRPDVQRLEAALEHYRRLAAAGGWPALPADSTLRPGDRDAGVVALRNRLRVSGDFSGPAGTADAWFYDGKLQRALEGFQARHGLPASGVPDERTLAALNVPAGERVAQLEATLLRWSWLPADFGPRYLWVNVPGGSLELVEDGAPTLAMRVIAGHPERPTPSFADTVSRVVVNPPWSVPRTIAVEDLLPSQQEDATFLARLGIRVFDPAGREQDATRVDWQRLSADRFPWRLRQDPGPLNSLGRLKFVLANPWDIFLHDTPSRRLFDLNSRTLSSGCVRLEEPEALARALGADPARLSAALAGTRTETLALVAPTPLYVVYLTAWVTPDGVVNFRPDVYGRDARLR